jgi:two-component system CheB/CheR fusion protein
VKGRQRAADQASDRAETERGLAEAAAAFAGPAASAAAAGPDVEAVVPIVAIGSSAGGLEALEQFFAAISVPSRHAFVIVQHLSPDFQSLMVELLARRTPLPVRSVEDGMQPMANAIHLIPPGKTMTIEAGLLRLAEPDARDLVQHPIDEFFVSLATDRGPAAAGILLSGSGSDGSRGARAIRASGGRVLVQRPATARFSSMPQAAIEAGCGDEVMAPSAMAAALDEPAPARGAERNAPAGSALAPILADCLEAAFGMEFAAYRSETVQRRVQRRMMFRGFDQVDAYAAFVADDADEQEALFQDLFIGTTGFCADDRAMAALERHVVPVLAARLDAGEPVRIWVPACATGEEAYAIAMLVLAGCRQPAEALDLAVTATDLHRRSLAVAAAGFYSEEAVAGLPADWLERFFTRRGSGHQAVPALRRIVGFATNDLLRDPPPTGKHLVSCRNLLVHLRPDAQAGVLAGLATSLEPGGHLLLGLDEAVPPGDLRFTSVDDRARLYRRRRAAGPAHASPAAAAPPRAGRSLAVATGAARSRERRDQRLTAAQELLLDRYVPPSLLVDEAGQVVHSFGDAGAWLAPASGHPGLDLLDMVVEPLRAPLAAAITEVRRTGLPLTLDRLPLGKGDAVLQRMVLEVPPAGPDGHRSLLVSFDDRPELPSRPDPVIRALVDTAPDAVAVAAGPDRALLALNSAMRDALAAAAVDPPGEGDPLDHVLACFRTQHAGPTLVPGSWTTPDGRTLELRTLPDTDTLILRLALPTDREAP